MKEFKLKPNYFVIPLLTSFSLLTLSTITTSNPDWIEHIRPNVPLFLAYIVLCLVFTLNTISILIVWNTFPRDRRFQWIIALIAFTMGFNLFFAVAHYQNYFIGDYVLEIGLLAFSFLARIIFIWPVSKTPALLLIPCEVWLIFSTIFYLFHQHYSL